MTITITTCGASGGEVTGSGYLVKSNKATVLVDFGMFQGKGATDERNADLGPVDPDALDAVVVTHAHLDHTGRLPLLAKHGYRGPIFATPATIDFATIILQDSGRIQESDLRRANKRRERAGEPLREPLYTADDVAALAPLAKPLRYETPAEVADGITIRFVDAGHILGSASVEMTINDAGAQRVIVFSGDVGRWDAPILRDPVLFEHADCVFLESTYGDADHPDYDRTIASFHNALEESIWQRQKVLIPAFAIGRTQEILYLMAEQIRTGLLPEFPIYLDSPMAIKATEAYRRHVDLFDEEASALAMKKQFRMDLRNLRFIETGAQSRELNDLDEASVIIAGSGMCDGGRIVHHLKHNLWKPHVTFLAVGYMTPGSLGREILDGAKEVSIDRYDVKVRATIRRLSGLSAHAGKSELLRWFEPLAADKPKLILTHGEDDARRALAVAVHEKHGLEPALPAINETLTLD